MEKDIKIGNYLRLGNGGLHKICEIGIDFVKDEKGLTMSYNFLERLGGYKIGKTKLELIQKGDIVNGKIVSNVTNGMIALNYCDDCNLYNQVIDNDDDIKEVLTKAQYENNCFKEE